jgi:hypothetical protein
MIYFAFLSSKKNFYTLCIYQQDSTSRSIAPQAETIPLDHPCIFDRIKEFKKPFHQNSDIQNLGRRPLVGALVEVVDVKAEVFEPVDGDQVEVELFFRKEELESIL